MELPSLPGIVRLAHLVKSRRFVHVPLSQGVGEHPPPLFVSPLVKRQAKGATSWVQLEA